MTHPPHHHRPQPTPSGAVRAELRAALHDLSDALRDHRPREQVLDAVRHAVALAQLAAIGEGLACVILRNLQRDLAAGAAIEASAVANQLNQAAERL